MKKKLLKLLVIVLLLLNIISVCSFFMSIWEFLKLDTNIEGFLVILLFVGDTMFIAYFQKIDEYLSDKIKADDVLNRLNRLNYLDYSKLKKIEHFTIEKRNDIQYGLFGRDNEKVVEYYELVTHIRNKHLVNIVTGEKSVEEHGLLFERINDLNQIPSTQEELEQMDRKLEEAENKKGNS